MSQSGVRPWRLVAVWAGIILIATSVPVPALPAGTPVNADKLPHLLMYGVLGLLLHRAWRSTHQSVRRRGGREPFGYATLLFILMSTVFAAAFGAFDEWHQQWFGRMTSLADWYADVIGGAIGALFGGEGNWHSKRRQGDGGSAKNHGE